MMNLLANLNWSSVFVAFVSYTIVGALWFTLFFPKQYKKSLGKEGETLPNKPIFIVGPTICSLVITVTSALLMSALHIQSCGSAFEFALVVGLGYLVANTTNIAINPNIPHPIHYSIISGSYHLVGIIIVSFILVAMGLN